MSCWPTLPAISGNNFLDHFAGSSLAARWGSFTSGSGAIAVADSYVDLNAPASSSAFLYYATQLNKSKSQLWLACVSYPTPGATGVTPPLLRLLNGSATPVADTIANYNTRSIIRFDYILNPGDASGAFYFNSTGVQTYWDPTVPQWTTTYPGTNFYMVNPIHADDFYVVGLEIDGVNSRWRLMQWGRSYTSGYTFDDGIRMFALTDWVTWANSRDSSNLWIGFGVPYNNDTVAHECRVEWVRYAEAVNNAYIDGWFDCSSTTGSAGAKAQQKHFWSFDGKVFVPEDRTTFAIPLGSNPPGYDDLDVTAGCCFSDGTNHWIYYCGSGSVTGSYTVCAASATIANPQIGPWTKSASNPLITLNAGESQVAMVFVFQDLTDANANAKYKMLFSIKTSSDNKWRLHYATAPNAGGPWTRQGMVLDVGSPGSFDELAARDAVVAYSNGLWEIWYEGWDVNGYATVGRAVGTTFGTFTKDGAGKRIGYQPYGDSPITANFTGRFVQVSGTIGFRSDARLIFCQSNAGNTYGLSRVRKVVDGTHLELYTGLDGFTTAVPARVGMPDSIHYLTPKLLFFDGSQWWFYVNTWQSMVGYDGPNYKAYRDQVIGVMLNGAPTPAQSGAPFVLDDLSFSVAEPMFTDNTTETIENMQMVLQPFASTGDQTMFDIAKRELLKLATGETPVVSGLTLKAMLVVSGYTFNAADQTVSANLSAAEPTGGTRQVVGGSSAEDTVNNFGYVSGANALRFAGVTAGQTVIGLATYWDSGSGDASNVPCSYYPFSVSISTDGRTIEVDFASAANGGALKAA